MLDVGELLRRCTFPRAGTEVHCAFSGGADSTALLILAQEAGCRVMATHVHHGLRPGADDDADVAAASARALGIPLRVARVDLEDGPNLEARARAARRRTLGPDVMTGHTLDDQAETLLLALLRGAGATGLSAMTPGWRHPILALRRTETRALCEQYDLHVADDPTNDDLRFRRNRIRHELLPLLDDIAERDVALLLDRTSHLLRRDDLLLEEMAAALDPTDVDDLSAAHSAIAGRAIRLWLTTEGYPPEAAAVERVLDVARGRAAACEIGGNRRVERHGKRLVLCPPRATTD